MDALHRSTNHKLGHECIQGSDQTLSEFETIPWQTVTLCITAGLIFPLYGSSSLAALFFYFVISVSVGSG